MKNRIAMAAAAAMLSLTTAASAITVPLGALDAVPDILGNTFPRTGNNGTAPFTFIDTYLFTLTDKSSIKGVLNVTSIPSSNTGSMSVSLVLRGGNPLADLGSDATDGDFSFVDLAAGDYFLGVISRVVGTFGNAAYSGNLATAAAVVVIDPPPPPVAVGTIPEPSGALLILTAAGFALSASTRRRRLKGR